MSDVQIHNLDKPDVILNSDRQNEAASLAQSTNPNGVKDGLVGNMAQKSLDLLSDGEGKDPASQLTKDTAINSFVTADSIRKNKQKMNSAAEVAKKDYLAGKKNLAGKTAMEKAQSAAKNTANYKGNLAALSKNRKLGNVKSVGATAGGFLSSALGESDEMQEADAMYSKARGARSLVNKTRAFRARRARASAKAAKQTAETTARTARAARAAKAGAAAKSGTAAGGAVAGVPVLVILLIVAAIVFLVAVINGVLAAVMASQVQGLDGDQALIAQTLSDKGYNNAQIAGIMSNMHEESGYNSKIFQADHNEYEYLSERQFQIAGGYGLCQWDGGRKRSVCSFCESQGVAHCDVAKQTEFVDQEIHGGQYASGKAASYEGYYY